MPRIRHPEINFHKKFIENLHSLKIVTTFATL